MTIAYQDIVLLNAALRARNLRYRVSWQDASIACVEPPGECCLTDDLKRKAYACIEQCFAARLTKNNILHRENAFLRERAFFFVPNQRRIHL